MKCKMEIITGVYKITNSITGDFYIGSSKNIKKRWGEHKYLSYQAKRPNSKLYKAFQTYGLDNFKFEVLEETSGDKRKNREQYYIQAMNPAYNRNNAEGLNRKRYSEYQREWRESNAECKREINKAYYSRICIYNGEELTLCALTSRFRREGIANPTTEAKKYLKVGEIN